ncbi:hypothetical protein [Sporotomaculum syntrophicum]|uniref:hypothetical protein n=1 Tax=Sporotomaculum syntrophicum TaxID=182264 RepID=UPI00137958D5|nr:hypothetical protein [Sporotomaculum syntrophicum]
MHKFPHLAEKRARSARRGRSCGPRSRGGNAAHLVAQGHARILAQRGAGVRDDTTIARTGPRAKPAAC